MHSSDNQAFAQKREGRGDSVLSQQEHKSTVNLSRHWGTPTSKQRICGSSSSTMQQNPCSVNTSQQQACVPHTMQQQGSALQEAQQLHCSLDQPETSSRVTLHHPGQTNSGLRTQARPTSAAARARPQSAAPAAAAQLRSQPRPRTASPSGYKQSVPHTQSRAASAAPTHECVHSMLPQQSGNHWLGSPGCERQYSSSSEQPPLGSVGWPDLTPYLTFPPNKVKGRPSSPDTISAHKQRQPATFAYAGDSLSVDQILLQLQDLLVQREQKLQDQDQQLQLQQQQCIDLQQHLQHTHAQLEAAQAQQQQQQQQQQQVAAQEAAEAAHASQISLLQQQLAAADDHVHELQETLHAQQVQHLQTQQQLQQQLDAATAAAQAQLADEPAQQQAASGAKPTTSSSSSSSSSDSSSTGAELLALLQSHTAYLKVLPPTQALLTDACDSQRLQEGVLPLCAALQQLVATLIEAASQLVHVAEQPAEPTTTTSASESASDAPGTTAGRTSGSTEALEGHLEETAVEVEQCMELLTQVVARTCRASEVGLLATQGTSAAVTLRRFSQLDVESKPAATGVAARRSSDDSI